MRLTCLIVSVTLATGCLSESDESVAQTEVGVDASVVSHQGFEALPDLILDDPELRHGWSDGDVLFQSLRSAHLRSDGSIVAVDGGANWVYVFRPDGSLADSIGGPGEGPGEFRDVFGTVLTPNDTLLIFDRRTSRVSVFSPDGAIVRTSPIPFEMTFAEPVGVSSSGAVVWRASGYRPTTDPGLVRAPVMVSRGAHTSLDTVAVLPSVEVVRWPDRRMAFPRPLSWLTRQAASLDGFVHVAPDSAAITWFDEMTGEPLRRLAWRENGVPVTDALWARYSDAQLSFRRARGEDAAALSERARQLREQRALAPNVTPIAEDVRSGQDGSIWIHGWTLDPAVEASEYLVVLDDGACLVRVRGENRFTFLDAARGSVLGREVGSLGEPSLVRYRAPECPTSN